MPNLSQSERRPLGTTTIQVHDDEFFNGYMAGNLSYRLDLQAELLTDHTLYAFLCTHTQSVLTTDRFRAGYISGWFAGLYGHRVSHQILSSAQPSYPERSVQA